MSTNPNFTSIDIEAFLTKKFHNKIDTIVLLQNGDTVNSHIFSFLRNGREYIIRFNKSQIPFQKDLYAYLHFNGRQIPIPPVLSIGKYAKYFSFAISEKVAGKSLSSISKREYKDVVSKVFFSLRAIHEIDESEPKLYGSWEVGNSNCFPTWSAYLLENIAVFKTQIKENTQIKKIIFTMERLLCYCPEERVLLHGNFQSSNIIIKGVQVSAILDWSHSIYGDLLYDIALLDLFEPFNYLAAFDQFYGKKAALIPHFNERIAFYKLFISMPFLISFLQNSSHESFNALLYKIRNEMTL